MSRECDRAGTVTLGSLSGPGVARVPEKIGGCSALRVDKGFSEQYTGDKNSWV